jgi:hypothetical protein
MEAMATPAPKAVVVPSVHRFPLMGGVAALRVPLVAALAVAGGLVVGAWDLAIAAAVLGTMAQRVWRSVVLEVSPTGLTRGFLLRGVFLGPTTVLPWSAIIDAHTDWCQPGDDTALETTVRGRDGTILRFSTAMGLRTYWTCLAAVADHVPIAARSGLTESTLSGGQPERGQLLAAARVAGALALLLVALVGLYYVLAQGRSSLARYLEDIPAAVERTAPR